LHKFLKISKKTYKALLFILIFIICLILFGKLLTGNTVYSSDILAYQLPEKYLIRESLIKGYIPFLNPFILSGTLFYSNIDAGVMNLMNVLLLLGNQLNGFNLFIFVHYFIAMLAMYFFLSKGLRYNKWIGLTGAVAYASGYLWSMSGVGFFRCGYLVPLFFLSIIKYLESLDGDNKGYYRRIALLASMISLSMLFYCGNFLEAYFSVIFAGILIIFQFYHLFIKGKINDVRILLTDGVLVLLMAFLLAAPILLPVISASLSSYRNSGIPIVEAQQWSFPPIRIIEYLVPFFYGARHLDGIWYGGVYNVEETFSKTGLSPWADFIYVGIPLLLGFYIFLRSRDKDWKDKFIVFALIFAFLLALGKFIPLYRCLYYCLPGFKMFRHPEKFLFWVNFWLIIGGCAGLKLIISDRERVLLQLSFLLKVLAAILGCLLICLLYLFLFKQEAFVAYIQTRGSMQNGDEIFLWEGFALGLSLITILSLLSIIYFLRDFPLRLLFAFFIVTIVNFAIWHHVIRWTIPSKDLLKVETWDENLPSFDKKIWRIFSTGKFLYPVKIDDPSSMDAFLIRKLMEYSTLDCNTPTIKQIRTVSGFTPVMDKKYVQYMNFDKHDPERVLDLLSVRYIAIHMIPESSLPAGTHIIWKDEGGEFVILENTDALPRIGTYSEFIKSEKKDSDIQVFAPKRNIHSCFVLEELPSNYDNSIKISGNSMAEIFDENTNQIKVKVQKGPCWVVVRDWFNPGWTCRSADKNLPIVKADGGLMAVFCSSNEAVLEFEYFPPGLKLGLILMSVGLVMLLAYFFWSMRKHDSKI